MNPTLKLAIFAYIAFKLGSVALVIAMVFTHGLGSGTIPLGIPEINAMMAVASAMMLACMGYTLFGIFANRLYIRVRFPIKGVTS